MLVLLPVQVTVKLRCVKYEWTCLDIEWVVLKIHGAADLDLRGKFLDNDGATRIKICPSGVKQQGPVHDPVQVHHLKVWILFSICKHFVCLLLHEQDSRTLIGSYFLMDKRMIC